MAHIALLYSDTGGGHRTAAEAIEQAILALAGGAHRVTLSNSIAYLPFPFNRSEATYADTMRHAPWLHRLSYRALDGDLRRRFIGHWAMALDGRRVVAFERDTRADVYVSCQPHFNPFMPRALLATGSKARYMHVVTDLRDVHAFHFTPVADLIIVPNEEVRVQAMRHRLIPDRLAVAGYPILPDFVSRLQAGPETRSALGLSADAPVLLLMGGGEGMGELYATAAELMRSSLPAQLIVICGRNTALKEALDALEATLPTRVLGFVDNVAELMGASDIIITKAGTGSLCEALAAGLPIIIYDAVPGQEDGNLDYMLDHGAAVYRPTHEGVLAQVETWLTDPQALACARDASTRAARPSAALEIARAVLAHLEP